MATLTLAFWRPIISCPGWGRREEGGGAGGQGGRQPTGRRSEGSDRCLIEGVRLLRVEKVETVQQVMMGSDQGLSRSSNVNDATLGPYCPVLRSVTVGGRPNMTPVMPA